MGKEAILRLGVAAALSTVVLCSRENLGLPISTVQADSEPAKGLESNFSALETVRFIDIEDEMHSMINEARQANGLPVLTKDTRLTDVARRRSREIIDQEYLTHYLPNGKLAFQVLLDSSNYGYRLAGENLARGESSPNFVPDSFAALMASREHRENMLDRTFSLVGIGYSATSSHSFLVQVFSNPI